jgi:hypothetical protein
VLLARFDANEGILQANLRNAVPSFFSGNLGSLSRVLSTVRSFSVVERESGNKLLQTVTYHWAD